MVQRAETDLAMETSCKMPIGYGCLKLCYQQTRVGSSKAIFERFMTELPTVKDLAEAPEDKL